MTTQLNETSVVTSIAVDVGIERAFDVFTKQLPEWWDDDHHLIEGFTRMEVQLHEGGRFIDHAADGSTDSWAGVLVYNPPTHFAFSWEINPQWQIETDPAKHSEVHVTFTAESDSRTLVTLEHRHLERHGEGYEGMRDAVGATGGWAGHLAAFAAGVTSAA